MSDKKISKELLRVLRVDIDAALQAVAKKHGIEMSAGNATFTDSTFTFKLEGKVVGGLSKEAATYDFNHRVMGLPPRDSEVTIGREVYLIRGMKSRGVNCILVERKRDGKGFTCAPVQLPRKPVTPAMPLADFVREVNALSKKQCDALNKKGGPFAALHTDLPEVMLAYYHREGMTPAETLRAIAAESKAELRAEARAS